MSRLIVLILLSCLGLAFSQPINFEGAVELKLQGGSWAPIFSGDMMSVGDSMRTFQGEAHLDLGEGYSLQLAAESELSRTPTGYALVKGKAYAEVGRLNVELGDIQFTLVGRGRLDAVEPYRMAVFEGDARYTKDGRVVFVEPGQQAMFMREEDFVVSEYFETDPWYQNLTLLGTNQARVQGLSGQAEIRLPGTDWQSVRSDSLLEQDGAARTGESSWLELIFANGNIVRLQALTEVNLKTSASFDSGLEQTVLEVSEGSIWLIVDNEVDQSFQINTPGLVAGVRGTTFRVIAPEPDQAAVIKVFDGNVIALNADGGTSIAADEQFDNQDGVEEIALDDVDRFNQARDELLSLNISPPLGFTTPLPEVIAAETFMLTGVTEIGALVELEGQPVALDAEGNFSVLLNLNEGMNEFVLDIRARGFIRREVLRIERNSSPPTLNFSNPLPQLVRDERFRLDAQTEAGAEVSINGIPVELDAEGNFSIDLVFEEGVNDFILELRVRGLVRQERLQTVRDQTPPSLSLDMTADITAANMLRLQGVVEAGARIQLGEQVFIAEGDDFVLDVPLEEGANYFALTVSDQAGNSLTEDILVVRDSTAPALEVTVVGGLVTRANASSIVGKAEVGAEVSIISAQGLTPARVFADGSFSAPVMLELGENVFDIQASDQAGNVSSQSVRIERNLQAPSLLFDGPFEDFMTDETQLELAGETDAMWLEVNGQQVALIEGRFQVQRDLGEGLNSFVFEAIDGLGNRERSIINVVRDTQAPDMTFFNLPEAILNVDEAEIVVLAQTEINATVTLNGQEVGLEESGLLRLPVSLVIGENKLDFVATDPLGNWRDYQFVIDYQP